MNDGKAEEVSNQPKESLHTCLEKELTKVGQARLKLRVSDSEHDGLTTHTQNDLQWLDKNGQSQLLKMSRTHK